MCYLCVQPSSIPVKIIGVKWVSDVCITKIYLKPPRPNARTVIVVTAAQLCSAAWMSSLCFARRILKALWK